MVTSLNIEGNKQEFIKRFKEQIGHREGAENLLNFILSPSRDFFTAPATLNDFLSVPGGLCQYALLLNSVVLEMFSTGPYAYAMSLKNGNGEPLVTKDSIAFVTLLSALDKILLFGMTTKNVKNFDSQAIAEGQARGESVKFESGKPFVWETAPAYVYDDAFPIGSGSRSIAFIQPFMSISKDEYLALHWGGENYVSGSDRGALNSALKMSVLATALQTANTTIQYLVANENYLKQYIELYSTSSSSSSVVNIGQDSLPLSATSVADQQSESVDLVDDSYPFEQGEFQSSTAYDSQSVQTSQLDNQSSLPHYHSATTTGDISDDIEAELRALDAAMGL